LFLVKKKIHAENAVVKRVIELRFPSGPPVK
jgi:hypothetical protein